MSRLAMVALLASLVAACQPVVTVEPLAPSPRPLHARSPDEVEIYESSTPERRYLEVAELRVEGGSLLALRAEAASIGCDALVIVEPSHDHSGMGVVNGKLVPLQIRTDAVATCAIWLGE